MYVAKERTKIEKEKKIDNQNFAQTRLSKFEVVRAFEFQVIRKIRPELAQSGLDEHGVEDTLHDLEAVRFLISLLSFQT